MASALAQALAFSSSLGASLVLLRVRSHSASSLAPLSAMCSHIRIANPRPVAGNSHVSMHHLLSPHTSERALALRVFISGGAGGEGAPDLTETLLNLSINSVALAAFSFLFFRDLQGAERDKKVVDREELLGRLLVSPAHVPASCPSGRQWSASCDAFRGMLSLPL